MGCYNCWLVLAIINPQIFFCMMVCCFFSNIWNVIVNILFIAPRMVYLSMIYLLWSIICRSECDVLTRRLRALITYWCHVCCLRFRRDEKSEGGHIHQTENPYHEQRSGIPSACHLQSNHHAEIWGNTWHQYVIKARSRRVETSYSLRQIMLQSK